jgi:Fe-S oxidoreductase
MATYKAEFRAHHYKGRLRPRAAYSMGLIREWSRAASAVPGLANALTQWPGVSAMAKWIGGIAPQRRLPRYANESFVAWFRRRPDSGKTHGERVMLWPDTFNNYFRPQTAIAATHVLESLGYTVAIPDRPLCCGRPLYDWGMLDRAKMLWTQTMDTLDREIREGTPIIGLEPACTSAFRDELPGLFAGHERAQKLAKKTVFLTEFIDQQCSDAHLPEISEVVLAQIHCHHHAVIKPTSEIAVLNRMKVNHEIMNSGCCGMAGSFGFERKKYDISITAAERVMLPRIRQAPSDTRILANGFSCREQIEQCTGRPTVHVAELIADHL